MSVWVISSLANKEMLALHTPLYRPLMRTCAFLPATAVDRIMVYKDASVLIPRT